MVRRIVPIVVALLFLSLLVPPSAAAFDISSWRPARCATGAFTDITVDYSAGYPTVVAEGWIQPCATAGDTNGFVTVGYVAGKGYVGRFVREYVSSDSPTEFSFTFRFADNSSTVDDGLRAFCVAYREMAHAACLRLTPGDELLVSPMSPKDPALAGLPWEYAVDTEPNCGTCA
jgi:hypothetical protein